MKFFKRKIYQNKEGRSYFTYENQRYYLDDIDSTTGLDTTRFTNAGYYGMIRVVGIDSPIDEDNKVIIEKVK